MKGKLYKMIYSKTCLKRLLKKRPKIGFQDQLSLSAGQKYCRMLQESILQYFRPALSYHLSLRPLFWLFWVGCSRQVLLYLKLFVFIYFKLLEMQLIHMLFFLIHFFYILTCLPFVSESLSKARVRLQTSA